MLRGLAANRREARLWSYGVLAATFLGAVVLAFAAEHLELRLLIVATAVVLLLVAGLEVAIAIGIRDAARSTFASSQHEMFHSVGGLHRFIERAREIDVLAGTGLAFTTEAENLRALDHACERGARARILLMHDEGTGIAAETFSRRARGVATPADELPGELRKSLARIAEFCGDTRATRIVKLYRGSRTMSLYRFDDQFFITLNTGGRGSSSPAFYVRWTSAHASFCDNVVRGFEEIWDSSASEAVTNDRLLELRSTAAHAPTPMGPARRSREERTDAAGGELPG